jgi:hypothetical protein
MDDVIRNCTMLETGGTLAPALGIEAIRRGMRATIYTFNLNIFDPTWFNIDSGQLEKKLQEQRRAKRFKKLRYACSLYGSFLAASGVIRHAELTLGLLESYLSRNMPIIAGLSATYLYMSARETPKDNSPDDVRGYPSGHFVVVTGVDLANGTVTIADPYFPNPLTADGICTVSVERFVAALLLGVITYDANLLILEEGH